MSTPFQVESIRGRADETVSPSNAFGEGRNNGFPIQRHLMDACRTFNDLRDMQRPSFALEYVLDDIHLGPT